MTHTPAPHQDGGPGPTSWVGRNRKRIGIGLAVLFVLIAVGLILSQFKILPSNFIRLFLVGFVVVVTFELSLRAYEEHEFAARQRAIEKDALKFLLGYSIDRTVMEEVHEAVFASKIIREDQSVTYQFHCADEPGFLRLR